MIDDYASYKALFDTGITERGCWALARRGFVDAHKASGGPTADEAIRRIAALYGIEEQARGLDDEARRTHRQRHPRRPPALARRPGTPGAG